jgi:hypothetical protein
MVKLNCATVSQSATLQSPTQGIFTRAATYIRLIWPHLPLGIAQRPGIRNLEPIAIPLILLQIVPWRPRKVHQRRPGVPDGRELHVVDRRVVVDAITGAVAVCGHAEADFGASYHVGRLRTVGGLERAPAAGHGRVVDADDGRDLVGLVPFRVAPPLTGLFGVHVAGAMSVSDHVGRVRGPGAQTERMSILARRCR